MSKVAATAGIGATGAILGVGGAYMLGAFGKPMSLDVPASLVDLKKGGDKTAVGVYFPGLTLTSGNEGDAWGSEDKKPADDFLKGTAANGGISHLLVNWEKYGCSASSTGKTWTGRIR